MMRITSECKGRHAARQLERAECSPVCTLAEVSRVVCDLQLPSGHSDAHISCLLRQSDQARMDVSCTRVLKDERRWGRWSCERVATRLVLRHVHVTAELTSTAAQAGLACPHKLQFSTFCEFLCNFRIFKNSGGCTIQPGPSRRGHGGAMGDRHSGPTELWQGVCCSWTRPRCNAAQTSSETHLLVNCSGVCAERALLFILEPVTVCLSSCLPS